MRPTVRTQDVQAIVFDLDGTLVQSTINYQKMVSGVTEILKTKGIEVDPSQRRIWEIIQRSEEVLREMGRSASEMEELLPKINAHLNAVELENVDKVTPIEGARQTLESLKAEGIKIGIATRSCNAFAKEALRRTGMENYVDVVLARDDTPHPKPDARHLIQVIEALRTPLNKAVFIGDTTTDLKTAREAGVTFIGCPSRPEWAERFRQEGCENLIESLRQLPDFLGMNKQKRETL